MFFNPTQASIAEQDYRPWRNASVIGQQYNRRDTLTTCKPLAKPRSFGIQIPMGIGGQGIARDREQVPVEVVVTEHARARSLQEVPRSICYGEKR